MKTRVSLLGIGAAVVLLAGLAAVIVGGLVWQLWPATTATSRLIRISAAIPLPTSLAAAGETAPSPATAAAPNPAPVEAITPPPPDSTSLFVPGQPADEVHSLPAQPPADANDGSESPSPLMRLVIPRLGLEAPVLAAPIKHNSWQVDHLAENVGHLQGTALPGGDSNIVLAGHVRLQNGEAGPFAALAHLMPGDEALLYHNEQEFRYIIDARHTVPQTAVEITYPSSSSRLTLITCSSWDDTSNSYQERLVVQGHLE